MGQTPPKFFTPSAPYGSSEAASALNAVQPAAVNPQTPLLPPNFQDPGTMQKQASSAPPTKLGGNQSASGGQDFTKLFKGMFGLLLLLFAIPCFATTTVTGKIQNLGTGNVTSGTFVRFWLRGCSGNQPRINGTSMIAPSQGGVFFFDIVGDASGNVAGTLYSTRDSAGTGNGEIECGGSKTGVWYGMQVFVAGKGGPEVAVHAKNGVTLNITNVTPITTNPVTTAPTGDSTYLRIDNGNGPASNEATLTGNNAFSGSNTHSNTETFTGATSAGSINATLWVCPVCQYTTLASAIAAAPSTGALIYEPLQEAFTANPFPPTSSGKAVTVQLGCGTWTTSVPIVLYGRDILRGCGRGDAGAFGTTIQATGGFTTTNSVKAVLQLGDAAFSTGVSTGTTGAFGTRLENVNIDCNSVASTVGIYSESINEQSGAYFFKTMNCPAQGVFIDGSHAQADGNIASDYTLENGEILPGSAGVAGTVLLKVQGGTAGPRRIFNITGIGNSSAKSTICAQFDNLAFGTISDLHMEQCVSAYGVGTSGISVGTVYENLSAKTGTNVLTIGNNANRTSVFMGLRNQGGLTNTINDLQNSYTTPNSECGTYLLDLNGKAVHNCDGGWTIPSVKTSAITNSTGLQLFNTSTTCSTSGVIDNACTTGAITLPVAYADTNYRLSCTGIGPTALPVVQTYTKSNTTFTITIVALTAAVSTFSSYDCMATHN